MKTIIGLMLLGFAVTVSAVEFKIHEQAPLSKNTFLYKRLQELKHMPYPFQSFSRAFSKSGFETGVVLPYSRSLRSKHISPVHPREVILSNSNHDDSFVKLFAGHTTVLNEVEVMTWNYRTRRYDFILIENYKNNKKPAVIKTAARDKCMSCHHNGGPIWAKAPWNESDFDAQAIAREKAAVPLASYQLDVTEDFDFTVRYANDGLRSQKLCQKLCDEKDLNCQRMLFYSFLMNRKVQRNIVDEIEQFLNKVTLTKETVMISSVLPDLNIFKSFAKGGEVGDIDYAEDNASDFPSEEHEAIYFGQSGQQPGNPSFKRPLLEKPFKLNLQTIDYCFDFGSPQTYWLEENFKAKGITPEQVKKDVFNGVFDKVLYSKYPSPEDIAQLIIERYSLDPERRYTSHFKAVHNESSENSGTQLPPDKTNLFVKTCFKCHGDDLPLSNLNELKKYTDTAGKTVIDYLTGNGVRQMPPKRKVIIDEETRKELIKLLEN